MGNAASSFPILKTERLVLRESDFSDVEEFYFLRSDPEVNKYLGGGRCKDLEAAKAHIKMVREQFTSGKTFNWSLCPHGSNRMVGSICLWNICHDEKTAEVGYALHPLHQNKGYMDESMKAVLEFGFGNEQYKRIEAYTDKNNTESTKLLLKNGFVCDDSAKDDDVPDNRIYRISRTQWLERATRQ